MRIAHSLLVLIILAATDRPCWGQFVRPPVVTPQPPVHVPVHTPVPHGSKAGGTDISGEVVAWVIGGIAVLGGLVGTGFLIYTWRKRRAPRAIIRIIALPPGEAPLLLLQPSPMTPSARAATIHVRRCMGGAYYSRAAARNNALSRRPCARPRERARLDRGRARARDSGRDLVVSRRSAFDPDLTSNSLGSGHRGEWSVFGWAELRASTRSGLSDY